MSGGSPVAASSLPVPIVYAAGDQDLYRSTDAGASWTRLGLYELGWNGIYSLAVDPSDSSTVYVGTLSSGVLKSSDGGASWKQVFNEPVACGVIWSLAIAKSPSTIYAGCDGGTQAPFFESTDGGATWAAQGSLLPDGGRSAHLALDPDRAGVLYLSAYIYVDVDVVWITYKSTDDGKTWTRLNVEGAPVLAASSGLVVVGKHRSTDGGSTWQELPLPLVPTSLAFDPADPATLYAGLFPGVYKSTDAGATWSLGNRGLFASSIQTLAIDPQQPTLYAWVQGLGLRKGVAGGTRWRRADAGLPLDAIFGRFETPALAIDPVVTSNLYLGWKNGFARSSDGGASWTVTSYDQCLWIRGLAIDPQDPGRLYASGSLSAWSCASPESYCLTFRSVDAGATWTCASSPDMDYVTEIAVDPGQPSRVYAATLGEGLWVSANRGDTWRKLKGLRRFTSTLTAFTVDPTDSRRLYVGDLYGKVLKSTDSGATWAEVTHGLPSNAMIRKILVDPGRPQTVYVASTRGVFISGNGGRTWYPLNGGLLEAPGLLVLDPKNPRKLYAGTYSNGVYAHERR
ncbi:MAG TPA: hypothetical protein VEW48_01505 [Thermoanaerobaculia bacterium]|nr:hypothetical protein [Thermoanaerobaculia bacterium]